MKLFFKIIGIFLLVVLLALLCVQAQLKLVFLPLLVKQKGWNV